MRYLKEILEEEITWEILASINGEDNDSNKFGNNSAPEDLAKYVYDSCEHLLPGEVSYLFELVEEAHKYSFSESFVNHILLSAKLRILHEKAYEHKLFSEKTTNFMEFLLKNDLDEKRPYSDQSQMNKDINKFLNTFLFCNPKNKLPLYMQDYVFYAVAKKHECTIWNKPSWANIKEITGHWEDFQKIINISNCECYSDINSYLFERTYNIDLFSSIYSALYVKIPTDKCIYEDLSFDSLLDGSDIVAYGNNLYRYLSISALLPNVEVRKKLVRYYLSEPMLLFTSSQVRHTIRYNSKTELVEKGLNKLLDIIIRIVYITLPLMENYFYWMFKKRGLDEDKLFKKNYYQLPNITISQDDGKPQNEFQSKISVFNELTIAFWEISNKYYKQYNEDSLIKSGFQELYQRYYEFYKFSKEKKIYLMTKV